MGLKLTRCLAFLAGLATVLASPLAVQAQDAPKVRFAYLKTLDLMPFFYGVQKGYFKEAGVDIELIAVPGGPAVGAAVASGSADIGYAAPTPIMIARDQGQPFKAFVSLEWERTPDRLWGDILATEKSGIKSLKDLKGKNLGVSVPGGLCELAAHDWLASVGLTTKDVNILNNPFPQMPAMMELGTVDAVCIVEPFATAALAGKSKPVLLKKGYLADVKEKYRVSILFASEKWIGGHAKEIAAIKKAFVRAATELKSNPTLVKEILAKEYRFPPALIDKLRTDFALDLDPKAEDYRIMVEKMTKYGMLKHPMKPEDFIAQAK